MNKFFVLFVFILFLMVYTYTSAEEVSTTATAGNAYSNDSTLGYMGDLKDLLNDNKKGKGTYLGVVSSTKGKELVDIINKEGSPIVIATSKNAFCLMKMLPDGKNHCMDNTGFDGVMNNCSATNISCKPPFSSIQFNTTTQTDSNNNVITSVANTNPQATTQAPTVITPNQPTTPAPTNTAPVVDTIKSQMGQLKDLFIARKTTNNTYFGVTTSTKGKELIGNINKEGSLVVIATSKNAFCLMKTLSDGNNYCIDSAGADGKYDDCSKTNIACIKSSDIKTTGVQNSLSNNSNASTNSISARQQLIEKIKKLLQDRALLSKSNIEIANKMFNEAKEVIYTKTPEEIKAYFLVYGTKATVDSFAEIEKSKFLASFDLSKYKDMTIDTLVPDNGRINVRIKMTRFDKITENASILLISENGEWKFGIEETLNPK
ncbi:MAG: hypothetical protein PHW52_02280 [Candidatus Pacebacteria bacterium]|nr:hypothetical protein [Candidatus Paceibacterota bacterium]